MAEHRYAILIACNEYNYEECSLPNLQFTRNDVDELRDILLSKKYGKFLNVKELINKNSYEIFQEIELILNKATNEDLVLIYFSGHGKLNMLGNLCLCTKNTKTKTLISTSIPIRHIKDHIEASKVTKIIIILDCCYSGLACIEFGSLKGDLSGEIILLSEARNRGIYVITSTTEYELSFENILSKHGEFTKHLLEGIRSWKAVDKNENITIQSLYSYIFKKC